MMRVMGLQIDLTELFEPEDSRERIQCIGMEKNKQVEITGDNCCNCQHRQL